MNNTTNIITAYAKVNRGRHRRSNEDAASAFMPPSDDVLKSHGIWLAVADGVGSRPFGQEVSQSAIEVSQRLYYSQNDDIPLRVRLMSIISSVNNHVRSHYPDGASTLIIGVILADKLHVIHIGDSRLYLVRGHNTQQVTEDHVKQSTTSNKMNLARAIGQRSKAEADYYQIDLQVGDIIVLLTDGATRYIATNYLASLVQNTSSDVEAVEAIIHESNEAGGIDNIGVALAKVHPANYSPPVTIVDTPDVDPESTPKPEPESKLPDTKSNKSVAIIGIISVMILIIVGGAIMMRASKDDDVVQSPATTITISSPIAATSATLSEIINPTLLPVTTNTPESLPPSPVPETLLPSTISPILMETWEAGMVITFSDSDITYTRLDDDTAAFTLQLDYSYRLERIFVDNNQMTWYRLEDIESGKLGWIEQSNLPTVDEIRRP